MDTLPAEIILAIASYACPKTQCRMAQVCNNWALALSSPKQTDRRKVRYAGLNRETAIAHYAMPPVKLTDVFLPNGEQLAHVFYSSGFAYYRDIYLSDRVIREKWDSWEYTCVDSISEFQSAETFIRDNDKKRAADDQSTPPPAPSLRDVDQ